MDGSHARARVDASFLRRHGFGAAADADPGRWQSHEHEREARYAAHADAQVRRWVIGEIGLGAALGFLSAWAAFRVHAGPDAQLDWVAVESAPLDAQTLRRTARAAAAATPEWCSLINALAETWPERSRRAPAATFDDGRVRLTLLLARRFGRRPRSLFAADAWNLDGFAPVRNAAAWSEEMIEQVASHSHAGTTVAAACVLPQVRARLERAGFRRARRIGRACGDARLHGARTASAAPHRAEAAARVVRAAGANPCARGGGDRRGIGGRRRRARPGGTRPARARAGCAWRLARLQLGALRLPGVAHRQLAEPADARGGAGIPACARPDAAHQCTAGRMRPAASSADRRRMGARAGAGGMGLAAGAAGCGGFPARRAGGGVAAVRQGFTMRPGTSPRKAPSTCRWRAPPAPRRQSRRRRRILR